MKFIIQSLPAGGDKWLFRSEVNTQYAGLMKLYDLIRNDRRLKVSGNSYRVSNKKGDVLFTLTEEQKNKII
jgi:hypothetical protein